MVIFKSLGGHEVFHRRSNPKANQHYVAQSDLKQSNRIFDIPYFSGCQESFNTSFVKGFSELV